MSTQPPKKPLSTPPQVTDEIDSEWGMKAGEPVKTATEAAVDAVAPASDMGPPGAARQLKSELKGQAETAAAPGTPPPPSPSEDEDEDEDDEDEDDEDDEEDGHEPVARARASHVPVVRGAAAAASNDWIPDWGPWAILGLLIVGGLVGGLTLGKTASKTEGRPEVAAASHEEAKPTSVAASHFLVQYKGALRAPANVTRTKEEAKARALEGLSKLKKGEDFGKVVAEYSDEPGAAARRGELGEFTADQMVKPFADAAFALKVGQVSGLVETDFGFHVIKRTK